MIKLIIIVILLESTSAAVIEPFEQLVFGKLVARQTTLFTCPANMGGTFCADDCKTLLTCSRRTTIPAGIRTCSDVSTSRPYCIPGERSCSSTSSSTVTSCATASAFICTNTGYFPDPVKCNQYHVCTEDSYETYECPPRYVYDAVNSRCKVRIFSKDCSRVNCARIQQKYVVYPARKSYYAYCGLAGEITMFRCVDTVNFEFNPTTVNCEFVCRAEGTYPDYSDEQQFYECYKSRGRLMNRIQRCPNTYVYDSVSKLCVKNTVTTVAPNTTPTMPDTTGTTPTSTNPTGSTPTTEATGGTTTEVTTTTSSTTPIDGTTTTTDGTVTTTTDGSITTTTDATGTGGTTTTTDGSVTTTTTDATGTGGTTTTTEVTTTTTDSTATGGTSSSTEATTTTTDSTATGGTTTTTDGSVTTTTTDSTATGGTTTTTDGSVTTTTTDSTGTSGTTTTTDGSVTTTTTTTEITTTTTDSTATGGTTTTTDGSVTTTTTDSTATGGTPTTTDGSETTTTTDSTATGGTTTTTDGSVTTTTTDVTTTTTQSQGSGKEFLYDPTFKSYSSVNTLDPIKNASLIDWLLNSK